MTDDEAIAVEVVQTLVSGIVAAIPGIPDAVVGYAQQIVAQLPALVESGTEIKDFIEGQLVVVRRLIAENRDPSDEEWQALNDVVAGELIKLSKQADSA
jgi:hypothetical protein